MKIALLVRRYITTGGAERYAVEVTRRLARAHEVHVFTQQWDHEPAGMTVHRVPRLCRKPAYADRWWFSWQTSQRTRGLDVVYSHEKVTQFDVMNVHCGTFVGGLRGVERGEKRTSAGIWLRTLADPSVGANWLLERIHYTSRPGRFWVADSEMVKREVQRYYPIADDRFLVAQSGVDDPGPDVAERRSEWRRRLGLGGEDVAVLFVASEFRRKGLGPLLEAMGRLGGRAPKLIVVGGDDHAPYAARATELQIAERITWAGRVNNVNDYYAAADVLVLPTLSDPSPLAPLEAMAHGCAVVLSCARYTGAAELIQQGEAILLEDPRNPAEIADAVTRLRDASIRQRYAEKGRVLARTLSWDRTAEAVSAALEKSWDERRPG